MKNAIAANKLPSILKTAMYIDCPLELPLLNNNEIYSPDIIKFCEKAAYFPSTSLNSSVIAIIIRKLTPSVMKKDE